MSSRTLFVLFSILLVGSTVLSVSIITRYFHIIGHHESAILHLPVILKQSKAKRQKQQIEQQRRSSRILSSSIPETTTLMISSSLSSQASNSTTMTSKFSIQAIRDMAKKLSRSFPLRRDSWCFAEKQRRHSWKRGLFFVKTKKASSSTAAGAVLRIMHQHYPKCQAVEWEHRYAREYGARNKNQSFLLGIVRDPSKRSLSQVYYSMVSLQNKTATDSNILSWLTSHREVSFNFQLRYMSLTSTPLLDLMSSGTNKTAKPLLEQYVKRTLKFYDFVLLAERMDESLVALSMVLGLPVPDVLTTPSKISGTSYQLYNSNDHKQSSNGDSNPGRCVLLQKPFLSHNISTFLHSDHWRATNYGDYLLHQAVNWSLDRTIDMLGRDVFDLRLQEYRRLQSAIVQNCFATETSDVIFPCSPNGTEQSERSKTSCYSRDFGCGYPCMDRTLKELSIPSALSQR